MLSLYNGEYIHIYVQTLYQRIAREEGITLCTACLISISMKNCAHLHNAFIKPLCLFVSLYMLFTAENVYRHKRIRVFSHENVLVHFMPTYLQHLKR